MKRREFLSLIAAAAGWPLEVRAQQQSNQRRIGLLSGNSSSESGKYFMECFVDGLRDLGWIDGTNLKIEIRWTEGVTERFSSLAAELVSANLDLIVVGSTPGAQAVQRATQNIPVVFFGVSDPVASGIVDSLSRPGGNVTGVSNFLPATSGKLMELLKAVKPNASRLGALHNPDNAGKMLELRELEVAAHALNIAVVPIEVRSLKQLPAALAKITDENCDGLITLQEGVTLGGRNQIAEFALRTRLPTVYQIREFVEIGGLISYGLNYCQHYRRGAAYVDKILKGARPADLPVELPTKYELVINLKTAKSIGIEIPPTLLATADEVIE